METRANYVVVGLFTLAVILGGFGFVYWFNTIGGAGDRVPYRIVFEGPVSGLRTGASVLFNGIRVGEVTDLRLDPAAPREVVASIAIDKAVAVRADTFVGLEYQGVTGTASIALRGGSPDAPRASGTPPTLRVDAGGAQDVTHAAARPPGRRQRSRAQGRAQEHRDFLAGACVQFGPHRQHHGRSGKPDRARRHAGRHRAGGACHQDGGREPRCAHGRYRDRTGALLEQRPA